MSFVSFEYLAATTNKQTCCHLWYNSSCPSIVVSLTLTDAGEFECQLSFELFSAWHVAQASLLRVSILESMFCSFQSDRTKNTKVLIFRDTEFASRQNSKKGATSAACNLGFKTLNPPLPYIFWTVWIWGFTRYHPKYTIPIQKIEKFAIEWSVFGLFLMISEVLYSESRNFQDLIVLGENYAFYHFVCHIYS